MKNILLIGTGRSVYLRDYCKYVLGDEMDISLISDKFENDLYYENNVKVYFTKQLGGFSREKCKEGEKIGKQYLYDNGRPDVCQIHFSSPDVITMFHYIWRRAKKRVLTFWGSDVYRLKTNQIKWIRFYSFEATKLIFPEKSLYEEFVRRVGHVFDKKCYIIDFGMPLYDEMVKLLCKSKDECKECFGIPKDKVSVHVGYNGSERQQHIKILKVLSGLPQEIKDRLYITIPCGYGGNDNYMGQLKKTLIESGLAGGLQREYLEKEKNAKLRYSCDVFLYGQISDAFSESPLEYAFMGAKMIMPSWLMNNYRIFDELSYNYWKVDDLSKIEEVLSDCLNCQIPANVEALRIWLKENLSWEHLAPIWREQIDG